ncbi:hypothetical protein ROZALSC1DRAFT_28070 [Rozella allomycis CSF55]|uniref:Uncharacterized protein n=1 Tax=Rozella allomycis (strain CSF55) TaxID=988480 RepID=A0A075ATT7_ROZAC|nr:hypothetical protein O9G_000443 [Rozella allomycis CSF55]RKP20444.1 hypothetical protein ROZALSC1DRAFT_28070 [Rozella allomycis CSF55]|eukprot:EPZ33668.1 hypothetical protein O9G_000443 [Rozella allomycis CSF55]
MQAITGFGTGVLFASSAVTFLSMYRVLKINSLSYRLDNVKGVLDECLSINDHREIQWKRDDYMIETYDDGGFPKLWNSFIKAVADFMI